jgi:hypothetical protein
MTSGMRFGETVTVLPRVDTGERDRYGKPVYAWPGPGIDIGDCAVEPTGADEPVEAGRAAVVTTFTVYDPHGTPIGPHERIVVRGRVCEVVGQPGSWVNPFTGTRAGAEIRCRIVEG